MSSIFLQDIQLVDNINGSLNFVGNQGNVDKNNNEMLCYVYWLVKVKI